MLTCDCCYCGVVLDNTDSILFVCRERSGSVVECLTLNRGAELHLRHCVVSLSKNINPSLVLVQLRKIHPFIRFMMGHKESNQTNKQIDFVCLF